MRVSDDHTLELAETNDNRAEGKPIWKQRWNRVMGLQGFSVPTQQRGGQLGANCREACCLDTLQTILTARELMGLIERRERGAQLQAAVLAARERLSDEFEKYRLN